MRNLLFFIAFSSLFLKDCAWNQSLNLQSLQKLYKYNYAITITQL